MNPTHEQQIPDARLALEALADFPNDPASMLDCFAAELLILEWATFADEDGDTLNPDVVRQGFTSLVRRMRIGAEALRRQYAREQATAPAPELRAVGGAR